MSNRYHNPQTVADMKTRVYRVDVSIEGKPWRFYSSAGAFNTATGYNLHPGIRADHIAANGGASLRIGDVLPELLVTLKRKDGGAPASCRVIFTRRA